MAARTPDCLFEDTAPPDGHRHAGRLRSGRRGSTSSPTRPMRTSTSRSRSLLRTGSCSGGATTGATGTSVESTCLPFERARRGEALLCEGVVSFDRRRGEPQASVQAPRRRFSRPRKAFALSCSNRDGANPLPERHDRGDLGRDGTRFGSSNLTDTRARSSDARTRQMPSLPRTCWPQQPTSFLLGKHLILQARRGPQGSAVDSGLARPVERRPGNRLVRPDMNPPPGCGCSRRAASAGDRAPSSTTSAVLAPLRTREDAVRGLLTQEGMGFAAREVGVARAVRDRGDP